MIKKNILIKNLILLLIITFPFMVLNNYTFKGKGYIHRTIRGKKTSKVNWTKDKFKRELKKAVERYGNTSPVVFRNLKWGIVVYNAFDKHKDEWGYEDWQDALDSAGIDVYKGTIWTKKKFEKKLRKIANELDTTSRKKIQEHEEGRKIGKVFGRNKDKWEYGSWKDAVKSVGLEPVKRINWTKDKFREKLMEVARRLDSTSSADFQNDDLGGKVYAAFHNHKDEWGYTTWQGAVKSVFESAKKQEKKKELSKMEFIKKLKIGLIGKLKGVAKNLDNTWLKNIMQEKKDIKLYIEFKNRIWKNHSLSDLIKTIKVEVVEKGNSKKSNMRDWSKDDFKLELKKTVEKRGDDTDSKFRKTEKGKLLRWVFYNNRKIWGWEDSNFNKIAKKLVNESSKNPKVLTDKEVMDRLEGVFLKKLKKVSKKVEDYSLETFLHTGKKGREVFIEFKNHGSKWEYDSWSDALRKAGIEIEEEVETWDKNLFKEKLKNLSEEVESTSIIELKKREEGRQIYNAFKKHKREWGYKNWDQVLKSAGVEPVKKVNWTKDLFQEKLKTTINELGTTSLKDFQNKEEGKKVYSAFIKNKEEWGYDSWEKAIRSIELEPTKGSKAFAERKFIEGLKVEFLKKSKEVIEELNSSSLEKFLRDKDRIELYIEFKNNSSKWGDKNWSDLIKSIEIETVEGEIKNKVNMTRWTKETFKEKLREVAERLDNPSPKDFRNGKEGQKIYAAFYSHKNEWGYETWEDALEAAAIK